LVSYRSNHTGVRQLLVYCLGKREGDWPCHHLGKLAIDRFQAEEVLAGGPIFGLITASSRRHRRASAG